jgi:hypothetical protein
VYSLITNSGVPTPATRPAHAMNGDRRPRAIAVVDRRLRTHMAVARRPATRANADHAPAPRRRLGPPAICTRLACGSDITASGSDLVTPRRR